MAGHEHASEEPELLAGGHEEGAAMSGPRDLPKGTVVRDSIAKKTGVVMAQDGARYYLRPCKGGIEWTARREDLSATLSDVLGPAVAELNANSRKNM
ncbi:hypothetical protein ACH41E_27530 [Streptomyces sp. NPDC020412]|uniref:hypothetical protein n=1 Tax=Streptomyces sp. NPDC020412 TaxID=3365073 RepID=UPI00379EF216